MSATDDRTFADVRDRLDQWLRNDGHPANDAQHGCPAIPGADLAVLKGTRAALLQAAREDDPDALRDILHQALALMWRTGYRAAVDGGDVAQSDAERQRLLVAIIKGVDIGWKEAQQVAPESVRLAELYRRNLWVIGNYVDGLLRELRRKNSHRSEMIDTAARLREMVTTLRTKPVAEWPEHYRVWGSPG